MAFQISHGARSYGGVQMLKRTDALASTHLEKTAKLAEWMLNSGIQNISSDEKKNGSFNSWYDIDKGAHAFMYSEITGYGITTLLYLYDITHNEVFLERAKLAGDWLLNQALHDCGGVIVKIHHDGQPDNNIFSFDNGMVLFGLTNLARVSKINKYSDGAETIADFLLSIQKNDGLMNAMFDVTISEAVNNDSKWSTQSGGYHAKISLGLIALSNFSGKAKYMNSAEKLCDASLQFQKASGRFIFGDKTHLHPHSYACEGLIYANHFLNKKQYINSIESAVKWAFEQQLKDGGLPTLYSSEGKDESQRTDILSQIVRLGVLMMQERNLPLKEKLELLYNRLVSFQNLQASSNQAGGMFYGYENGQKMNHINSWCSMFALQAIDFYHEYAVQKNKVKIDYLV